MHIFLVTLKRVWIKKKKKMVVEEKNALKLFYVQLLGRSSRQYLCLLGED